MTAKFCYYPNIVMTEENVIEHCTRDKGHAFIFQARASSEFDQFVHKQSVVLSLNQQILLNTVHIELI